MADIVDAPSAGNDDGQSTYGWDDDIEIAGYKVKPWLQFTIVIIIFTPLLIWQATFIRNVYKFIMIHRMNNDKHKHKPGQKDPGVPKGPGGEKNNKKEQKEEKKEKKQKKDFESSSSDNEPASGSPKKANLNALPESELADLSAADKPKKVKAELDTGLDQPLLGGNEQSQKKKAAKNKKKKNQNKKKDKAGADNDNDFKNADD